MTDILFHRISDLWNTIEALRKNILSETNPMMKIHMRKKIGDAMIELEIVNRRLNEEFREYRESA